MATPTPDQLAVISSRFEAFCAFYAPEMANIDQWESKELWFNFATIIMAMHYGNYRFKLTNEELDALGFKHIGNQASRVSKICHDAYLAGAFASGTDFVNYVLSHGLEIK